jgi:hypothetical protein
MEPYDDSKPYPPEWEGEKQDNPLAELLRQLLGSMEMPQEIREKLLESARQTFREAITKFATLAIQTGASSYERLVAEKQGGAEGFHAGLHFNINEESLKAAGITREEVQEVWEIHAEQLGDFFESIKRQNIDKGFASDG